MVDHLWRQRPIANSLGKYDVVLFVNAVPFATVKFSCRKKVFFSYPAHFSGPFAVICPKIPKIPNQNPLIPKSPFSDGDGLRRVTRVNGDRWTTAFAGVTSSSDAWRGWTPTDEARHSSLIFKFANCSSSCFVVAYIFLDRFVHSQPLLPINSFNVHRFSLPVSWFLSSSWMICEFSSLFFFFFFFLK